MIVNYGGQYVHRIWRSLRYLGVESEMVSPEITVGEIHTMKPEGIILSGGAYSVYLEEDQEKLGNYREILELDYPILGICLGHQLIAHYFGGLVEQGSSGEYAAVELTVKNEDDLFKGLPEKLTVWESHRDEVVELPPEFRLLASSEICENEAIKHNSRKIYGVQFHPEVHHTPEGSRILENYIRVCK